MPWLIGASIIWGFSFGILKGLVQQTDPFVVNSIRTLLASLFFLPWFFSAKDTVRALNILRAFICGAIQIGLMYGPYALAFKYITAHEVAFFTMTTPIIMASLFLLFGPTGNVADNDKDRAPYVFLAAIIATIGGLFAAWDHVSSFDLLVGAGLIQMSNVFFAFGIILWSRWFTDDRRLLLAIMTPYFLGAASVSTALTILFSSGDLSVPSNQWPSLLWLGFVASGIGFFLWNKGALRVNHGALSVANNLKLPIAIIISLAFFHEQANLLQLLVGTALVILALWIAAFRPKTKPPR